MQFKINCHYYFFYPIFWILENCSAKKKIRLGKNQDNLNFTVHICSARAQIQYFKSSMIVHFGVMILGISLIKILQSDGEKCNKILYSKLIRCIGTYFSLVSFSSFTWFSYSLWFFLQISSNSTNVVFSLKNSRKSAKNGFEHWEIENISFKTNSQIERLGF